MWGTGDVLGLGGRRGIDGLVEGLGQARAGGGGLSSPGSPWPQGPHPFHVSPVPQCAAQVVPGPHPADTSGRPSPSIALLVGDGGAWMAPPASATALTSICS